jgi:membrane protease YdiL (CAAX protease family)
VSLAQQRPVGAFFALTFLISWGTILIVVGPRNVLNPQAETAALLPVAIVAMMIGPFVSGLAVTALVRGRSGLRELLARALRWRAAPKWYAVALLTAPVSVLAALLTLSLLSPEYLPTFFASDAKGSILTFALLAGVAVAIFEETGWTGFAVPELRRTHAVLWTGLIIGIVWGAWHLLVNVWGSAEAMGSVPQGLFLLVVLFSFLPPYRVLMVTVYDRTGSLLLVVLMHTSLIAFWQIFTPEGISGWPLVRWYLTWAGVLWLFVAVLTAASARSQAQPAAAGAR